jgi:site-specific DNA recombinase
MRVTLGEIERRGWRLKSWMPKTGHFHAGGPFSLGSLQRLLTNIFYTGALRHQGQCYAGEHAAIIAPEAWERVQDLITHHGAFARGGARNKHQALLSGLLYCECCAARMVFAYSGRKDRRYPYYVCRNAQRRGWAECPAKSLSARAIEESVLERIRQERRGILECTEWDRMDRTRQIAAVRSIVERVGYDGRARQVIIRFHARAIEAVRE